MTSCKKPGAVTSSGREAAADTVIALQQKNLAALFLPSIARRDQSIDAAADDSIIDARHGFSKSTRGLK